MQITGLWMSRSLVTLPTFRAENSEPASLSKTLLTTLPTMRQRISRNLWRWRVCWFFHNLLHARRLEAWKDYELRPKIPSPGHRSKFIAFGDLVFCFCKSVRLE